MNRTYELEKAGPEYWKVAVNGVTKCICFSLSQASTFVAAYESVAASFESDHPELPFNDVETR